MSKHVVLNTTLPPELKDRLSKQALDNGRSIKKELELILKAYFQSKADQSKQKEQTK